MLTRLFFRGFITLAVFAIPAHTMTVIATFGSSITSDANSAAIQAGILAAIGQIQSQFSDPISVPITFEEGGGARQQLNLNFSGELQHISCCLGR